MLAQVLKNGFLDRSKQSVINTSHLVIGIEEFHGLESREHISSLDL